MAAIDIKSVIEFNKQEILKGFKEKNVDKIVFAYSGSGDSCEEWYFAIGSEQDDEDFEMYPIDKTDPDLKEPLKTPLTIKNFQWDFSSGSSTKIVKENVCDSLHQALNEFVIVILESGGCSGFENNEGGSGKMVIEADSNILSVNWTHYEYFTGTNTYQNVI